MIQAPESVEAHWRTRLWLAASLLALLALASLSGLTRRLDHWFYDGLITQHRLAPAPDLAVIAIDGKSLRALGRWPWNRRVHAALLQRLRRSGAKVVALDILFPEPSSNPADDEQLAQAMRQQGRVVLPVHIYPQSAGRPLQEILPIPKLTAVSAALGHAQVPLGSDSIARGLYLRQGLGSAVWPCLAAAAAHLAHPALKLPPPKLATSPFVNVRQDYVRIPFAADDGAIPVYSYIDVLDGSVPASDLAGKVIFVGATAAGLGDHLPTPVSAHSAPMSGVMFHANVYSALVRHATIHLASPWVSAALALLILILLLGLLPKLPPGQTFLFCCALTLVCAGSLALTLLHLDWWIAPAWPLLLAFLAWPVWNTQRLVQLGAFLNRQIDLLGHATRRSPFINSPRPDIVLSRLTTMLAPQGSCLMQNGVTAIDQGQLSLHPPPLIPDDGRWHHLGEQSWIRLHHRGRSFTLGLAWPGINPLARHYLDRLDLRNAPLPELARNTGERLSARIAQAQQASQSLAQLHGFVEAGFDQMAHGMVVVDALGLIRFANGNAALWLDQPLVSLEGMAFDRLLNTLLPRQEHSWRDTLADTLVQGERRNLQIQLSGRDLLLHLVPFRLEDSGQSGAIATFADITSLCDQQRQQRQAIDFISHDVRSPLVSQLALIAQLKRDPTAIDHQQLDQLARLARRSYQLAEEFVQLARAEQLSSVRFYECEALSIVENAVDAVHDQAQDKQVKLSLNGEESLWLSGNAELLERAIINLLTNAIKYSPSDTEVRLSVSAGEDLVRIDIRDQGPGLDPEELPHLFQRFRRQRKSELSGQQGTGLGLAFVKVVVDKHQGRLEVDSGPGKGTRISILLPLHPSPSAQSLTHPLAID